MGANLLVIPSRADRDRDMGGAPTSQSHCTAPKGDHASSGRSAHCIAEAIDLSARSLAVCAARDDKLLHLALIMILLPRISGGSRAGSRSWAGGVVLRQSSKQSAGQLADLG